MAHFAKLNDENIVEQVIVVGDEYEDTYAQWRLEFGERYVQTSYNANFRFNFAGIGYTYDPIDDAFIPPIPCDHLSLTLTDLKRWECADCEAAFKSISDPTA